MTCWWETTPLGDARSQVAESLWVVASTLDLAAAEIELSGVSGRELILRDKLREDQWPLDYLLVDCPPSLGILTLNALAAVEEVFIPLQPHFLALHGLSRLLETIGLVAERLNPAMQVSGVVLCMYDAGTRLAAKVGQNVDTFFQTARGQPLPGPRRASRRGFAATSAWPRRRASGSRSSSTHRARTERKTTSTWPRKSPPGADGAQCDSRKAPSIGQERGS